MFSFVLLLFLTVCRVPKVFSILFKCIFRSTSTHCYLYCVFLHPLFIILIYFYFGLVDVCIEKHWFVFPSSNLFNHSTCHPQMTFYSNLLIYKRQFNISLSLFSMAVNDFLMKYVGRSGLFLCASKETTLSRKSNK